jgi:hypothetical protein
MGGGGIAPPFVTSALDGGEWSGSRLNRFAPEEIVPGIHWIEGRKEKNLLLAGNRIPTVQPVARCYTDWAIPTLILVAVETFTTLIKNNWNSIVLTF